MAAYDFFEIAGILTRLDIRASGVWISHLATKEKLEQMGEIKWYDPNLDRYENKSRMKEFGAAGMNFKSFIAESQIIGLSNSLETFWIDLRLTLGVKYDIWKAPFNPSFEHEAKIVRCIGNIVKHNQSIIEKKNSDSAKYLVDEAGFPNSIELSTLFISESALLRLADLNYLMYIYCLDLLRLLGGVPFPILDAPDPERRERITGNLVPSILKLR